MSELTGRYVIGFTGTRNGMTAAQKKTIEEAVYGLVVIRAMHMRAVPVGLHGDCFGADADFNAILAELKLPRFCRPCNLTRQRSFTDAVVLAEPEDPLIRNTQIVFDSSEMIAAPSGVIMELRSGTWATVRRARKQHKPLRIVFPDGSIHVEGKHDHVELAKRRAVP